MATRRERIMDSVTVLVALCAITLTGMVVSDKQGPQPDAAAPVRVANWRQYAAAGHRFGPADAPVTIVVFGDYECPACRRFEGILESVKRAHLTDLAIVYRHWPLTYHRMAYPAARAAECSAVQGRFLEYHQLLHKHPDFLGASWSTLAVTAGVPDSAAFAACISRSDPVTTIERDIADAREIGGRGTPTILINNLLLRSVSDSAALERIIREVR